MKTAAANETSTGDNVTTEAANSTDTADANGTATGDSATTASNATSDIRAENAALRREVEELKTKVSEATTGDNVTEAANETAASESVTTAAANATGASASVTTAANATETANAVAGASGSENTTTVAANATKEEDLSDISKDKDKDPNWPDENGKCYCDCEDADDLSARRDFQKLMRKAGKGFEKKLLKAVKHTVDRIGNISAEAQAKAPGIMDSIENATVANMEKITDAKILAAESGASSTASLPSKPLGGEKPEPWEEDPGQTAHKLRQVMPCLLMGVRPGHATPNGTAAEWPHINRIVAGLRDAVRGGRQRR